MVSAQRFFFFDEFFWLFKTQEISENGIVDADHDDKAMYEGWLASL